MSRMDIFFTDEGNISASHTGGEGNTVLFEKTDIVFKLIDPKRSAILLSAGISAGARSEMTIVHTNLRSETSERITYDMLAGKETLVEKLHKNKHHRLDGPAIVAYDTRPNTAGVSVESKWRVNGEPYQPDDRPSSIRVRADGTLTKIWESARPSSDLPRDVRYYPSGNLLAEVWLDESNNMDRDGDNPAYITYYDTDRPVVREFLWQKHGVFYRKNGPAYQKFTREGNLEEEKYFFENGVQI